jgi:formate hydrogenlyase subunit 6/NADH:ubiquinone oxidoreductase subunit I
MPAHHVPTMNPAARSGLGRTRDDEIEVCGDEISRLECPDFEVVRQPAVATDRSFPYYLKKWVTARPFIDPALCVNCGICTDVCPLEPKAVQKKPGDADARPVYDYPRCIRCYCCQEMCPHGAISIRRPLLSRLIRH